MQSTLGVPSNLHTAISRTPTPENADTKETQLWMLNGLLPISKGKTHDDRGAYSKWTPMEPGALQGSMTLTEAIDKRAKRQIHTEPMLLDYVNRSSVDSGMTVVGSLVDTEPRFAWRKQEADGSITTYVEVNVDVRWWMGNASAPGHARAGTHWRTDENHRYRISIPQDDWIPGTFEYLGPSVTTERVATAAGKAKMRYDAEILEGIGFTDSDAFDDGTGDDPLMDLFMIEGVHYDLRERGHSERHRSHRDHQGRQKALDHARRAFC